MILNAAKNKTKSADLGSKNGPPKNLAPPSADSTCYHSEESARISVIAMVITANEGGTLVAPKNRDLAHAA